MHLFRLEIAEGKALYGLKQNTLDKVAQAQDLSIVDFFLL
jgi:hypothetical protein